MSYRPRNHQSQEDALRMLQEMGIPPASRYPPSEVSTAAAAAASTIPPHRRNTIMEIENAEVLKRNSSYHPGEELHEGENYDDYYDDYYDDEEEEEEETQSEASSTSSSIAVIKPPLFEPPKLINDKPGSVKTRSWFLTIFRDNGFPRIPKDIIKYCVISKEICPETKRIHWHAVVEFKESVSMLTVKREFQDNTINCQVRKGTLEQAEQYVTKTGEYEKDAACRFPGFEIITIGERPRQGKRSDLDFMVDAVFEGATKYQLLKVGGGNVLRHLGMIDRAQRVVHGVDKMDNFVMQKHKTLLEVNKTRIARGKPSIRMSEAFHLLTLVDGAPERQEVVDTHEQFEGMLNDAERAEGTHIAPLIAHFDEMIEYQLEREREKQTKASKKKSDSGSTEKKKVGRPKKQVTPESHLKQYARPFAAAFVDRTIDGIIKACMLHWEQSYLNLLTDKEQFTARVKFQFTDVPAYMVQVETWLREDLKDILIDYIAQSHRDPITQEQALGLRPSVMTAVLESLPFQNFMAAIAEDVKK